MTELLTAAQMRAIDAAAIVSGEVTGLELMERAGQGVVDAAFAEWPELGAGNHRAVVLCGPGNNGGDGYVVARLLKAGGWDVDVFSYGDTAKLPPDARVNYERWCKVGEVTVLDELEFRKGPCADLYVDALFGTGLRRPPEAGLAALIRYLDGSGGDDYRPRMVAIDMPSGVCADSGRVLTEQPHAAFQTGILARLTVTFDSPKVGQFLQDGPHYCGKIVVRDIGLQSYRETMTNPHTGRGRIVRFPMCSLVRKDAMVADTRPFFAIDERMMSKSSGHKFAHGHAFILSGGVGRGGAARLAARGALRIGSGVVTVGCPPAALLENAIALDAVMTRQILDADGLAMVLEDERINALCLGPGLGAGTREAALAKAALACGRALVLDADALTLLAGDSDLFGALHRNCVLTPHAGEFARLFPDIAAKLDALALTGPAYSKVDAACEAAKRAGCVVLFKGPDTVIAEPSGRCSVNASVYERSAPWLATAGSGDVLAGFITGLLARGFAPMHAAEVGAWLHTECALSFGPGLIAEDLPEELPKVFRSFCL